MLRASGAQKGNGCNHACDRKNGVILSGVLRGERLIGTLQRERARRSRKTSNGGLASEASHSLSAGQKSQSVAATGASGAIASRNHSRDRSSESFRKRLPRRRCRTAIGGLSTPSSARKTRLDCAQDDTVFRSQACCCVAHKTTLSKRHSGLTRMALR